MNQLDRGASNAGERVLSTAQSLKKIAEELRSDDLSRPAAQLADRGAQTLEQVGNYLQASSGDTLIADAERYGRDRPWVIASAGMVLGLAGSRMLKASAARRYRGESDEFYSAGADSYSTSAGAGPKSTAGSEPNGNTAAPFAAAANASPARTSTAYDSGSESSDGPGAPSVKSGVSKRTETERLTGSDGS